jgi:hypothetical protein
MSQITALDGFGEFYIFDREDHERWIASDSTVKLGEAT